MPQKKLEYLIAFIAAYSLAALLSWPLCWQGDQLLTSSIAEGDMGFTLFAQWWLAEALLEGSSLGWSNFVQYPEGSEILRQLWNLPVILLTAPLHFIFSPLMAYNQSILLIVALNGLAAYLLGRRWGIKQAYLALVIMISLPYTWNELGKGRLEQGFLAPMLLWIWSLYHLRDSHQFWPSGLAMALVANCYWFYAPMAAILVPFILTKETIKHLPTLLKAALLSILLSLPQIFYVSPIIQQFQRQATFGDPEGIRIQMENAWWPVDSLSFLGGGIEGKLPLVAILLLLISAQRKWIIALSLFAFVMALGPILSHQGNNLTLFGHSLLLPHYYLDVIPIFMRFYWPYRWLSLLCCAIVLAAVHCDLSKRNILIAASWFLIEGYLLLPVGFNPTLNTAQSDPYTFPAQGRYLSVAPSSFFTNIEQSDKAILPFPTQNHSDRHVFWIPFHQHSIATFPNNAGHSKVLDKLAQEDHGGFYSAWLNGRSICQHSFQQSLPFLQAQGFGWIIWHKATAENAIQSEELYCLQQKLGEPLHHDSQISVWQISP